MTLWYQEHFDGEMCYSIRVERTLYTGRSEFQQIDVVDTKAYGRVLVIDGIFMTSEKDEYFYHEMIVHPALVTVPSMRRVLIIGGGDGGTAREVLRHPSVEQVTMVEIDGQVVEVCKRYLPGLGAWDDPRLEVITGDGIAYAREAPAQSFDVVLLDGTDPIGPGEGLFNREFYRDVKRLLNPNGVFVLQSESPITMRGQFLDIQRKLVETFTKVMPYFGPVPIYSGGIWSWTYATETIDPQAIDLDRIATIESDCKYYNRDIHRAAFVLPNYLRREFAKLSS